LRTVESNKNDFVNAEAIAEAVEHKTVCWHDCQNASVVLRSSISVGGRITVDLRHAPIIERVIDVQDQRGGKVFASGGIDAEPFNDLVLLSIVEALNGNSVTTQGWIFVEHNSDVRFGPYLKDFPQILMAKILQIVICIVVWQRWEHVHRLVQKGTFLCKDRGLYKGDYGFSR